MHVRPFQPYAGGGGGAYGGGGGGGGYQVRRLAVVDEALRQGFICSRRTQGS